MLHYDPAGGSYAFSYIGYNGTMAGGGDTEDSRWDYALKYRLTYGPVHFGAMYKFADGSAGCYSATAGWTACHLYAGIRRITTLMDSISAGKPASSPPTSSSNITTRRSAY